MTPEETNSAVAERLGIKYPYRGEIDRTAVNFHGSLDAAMQLVEKAKEMGWLWHSDNIVRKGNLFTVFFTKSALAHHATGQALSAAICEAFLKLPQATTPEGDRREGV